MSIDSFFVLASSSKSRISILKNAGLRFKGALNTTCDEKYYKKIFLDLKYNPNKISLELSKLKAQSLNIKNTLVVGSDTVIDFGGKTIDKATNVSKEAKKKIKKLSGKKHTIVSSVSAYYNKRLVWCCTVSTKVKIKKTKRHRDKPIPKKRVVPQF